jgi:hypothetical protein
MQQAAGTATAAHKQRPSIPSPEVSSERLISTIDVSFPVQTRALENVSKLWAENSAWMLAFLTSILGVRKV